MFKKRKNKLKEDVPITGDGILEKQTTNIPIECLVSEDGNGLGTDEADGFDSQGFVDLTPQRQPTLLGPKKPCQETVFSSMTDISQGKFPVLNIHGYVKKITQCTHDIKHGTFAVSLGSSEDGEATLTTHKERTRFVKKKLKEYRFSQKGVLVALLISSDGIKVVRQEGKRVRMAHPLQRISFATCEPDFRLFAYMSHNPSPLGTAIHCHVFMTRYTRQVQELTALVGKAFQMAFAQSKFPNGAELKMEPLKTSPMESGAPGRRWARLEAQQGHEHSQHALLARVKREQEKATANKTQETSKQKATPPAPKSTPQTSVSMQRPYEKGTTPPETRRKNISDSSSATPFQEAKPLYLDSETDGSPVMRKKELKLSDILDIDSSSPRSTGQINSPISPPLPPKQRSFDEHWSPSAKVELPRERSQTPPPSAGADKSISKAATGSELNSALIKSTSDPNFVAERKEVNVNHIDKPGKGTSHEDKDWYMAGIPREFVTEMLEKSEEGSFFVRDSQSRPGCYALTMRIPSDVNQTGIGNFLIVKIKDGFMIQGFNKVLPDLPSLVEHYSKNSDGLPCKLLIAGSNVLCEDDEYLNTVPIDPDYQTLSDFTAMMAELN